MKDYLIIFLLIVIMLLVWFIRRQSKVIESATKFIQGLVSGQGSNNEVKP